MDDTAKHNKNSAQKAMLGELESIKELLLENSTDDIPVLESQPVANLLENNPPVDKDTALPSTSTISESGSDNSDDLPEVHALDDSSQLDLIIDDTEKSSKATPLIQAKGENPFLPQHIRDRLQGNTTPSARSKITELAPAKTNVEQVIDNIIEESLPEIKAKLRAQLQPLVERQLANKSSEI